MQATIDTLFVNEKVIKIYSFRPFSLWNTRQMHLKVSIVTKPPVTFPPPNPLKYLTMWGGGVGKKECMYI